MKFSSKVFLAPMAGITDAAFRDLATRCGAGLTTTELISAQGLLQNNAQSKALLRRGEEEKNFAVQLFGANAKSLANALKLAQVNADYIDLNAGCPVTKVCKTGAGSALLTNLKLTGEILDAMNKVIDVPLTVKMRLGIKDNSLAQDFARLCEEKDVKLLTVHGRTQKQMYAGKADWQTITKLSKQSKIPIVGNGDINSPETAKEKLQVTPYVAIGRSASGNPYLFTQCNDFLKKGKYKEHSFQRQFELFSEYLKLAKKYDTHFMHQLLQAQHFFKGIPGAAKFRLAINSARSQSELLTRIEGLISQAKSQD